MRSWTSSAASTTIGRTDRLTDLKVNNSLWPLPKDYAVLTKDGQRKARTATCSLRSTPEERVAAWTFFREYYLMSLPPGMFYPADVAPSPPCHYQIAFDEAKYKRNFFALPRGFGKSIIAGTELPMLDMLTRPYFTIGILLSTLSLLHQRFNKIRTQLATNSRIIDDFGDMKPSRFEGQWSLQNMTLANGATLTGYTVTGAKRGGRHQKLIVDDPERDLRRVLSWKEIQDDLKELLFKQLIPMLPPEGSVAWICTIISMRSFAWYALSGQDKRINLKRWNRRIYAALDGDVDAWMRGDKDAAVEMLWPTLWTDDVLRQRMEEMGHANFASEYLNRPASEQAAILTYDAAKHSYAVDPPTEVQDPFNTLATIEYTDDSLVRVKDKFTQVVQPMFRLLSVDYAPGRKESSDYSAIAVGGYDSKNALWLLDLWQGRVSDNELINLIYHYGHKWLVKVVGVESAGLQLSLLDRVGSDLANRALEGWSPQVVPIKSVVGMAKEDHMGALEWRYTAAKPRIYLPGHLLAKEPWKTYMFQADNFTMDLSLLQHDDCLDVVSMLQRMVHQPGSRQAGLTEHDPLSHFKAALQDGQLMDNLGIPVADYLSPAELRSPEVRRLLEEHHRAMYNKEVAKNHGTHRLSKVSVTGGISRRNTIG